MSPIKRFLYMVLLTGMWSPSFLFIKLAVHELPPLTIVSLRVSLAALVLATILFFKQTPLPTSRKFWLNMATMALFSSMLPFCLFCYAEQTIDSALAAILNGTSPMFTAILAQLFVASDRMNAQKIFGVFLSCLGVILLFIPQLSLGISGTSMGMSAAMLASFCYAVSHIYGKLNTSGYKPFVGPAAQLIASSLILWPIALWHDEVWRLPMPSIKALSGVCGLAFFGTICAFIIYYKLLDHSGPTAISTVSCFFPVGGMLLGFIFLEETFTFFGMFASMIILLGMLMVNNVISLGALKLKAKPVSDEV